MIPRRRVPLLSSNPPAAEYYGETVKPIDVLRFWHKSIFQRLIYRCNARTTIFSHAPRLFSFTRQGNFL